MSEPVKETKGEPTAAINVVVLAALMALLGGTVAVSMIDVDRYLPGHGWGLPIAMGIAALKAALVVGYFMHVRYQDRLTQIFAAAGAVWLAILLVLVTIEVATR